ncbi:hypothetical protein GCM10028777_02060 [Angustibacter speluncae]
MTTRSTLQRTTLLTLVTAVLAALLVAAPPATARAAEHPVRTQAAVAAEHDASSGTYVRPHCERVSGAVRCGLKYTNTESKVLVAAAIAALAAGGVVACKNVVACKILVATVGAALTTWWTAVVRDNRCLFSFSTGTSSRFALVRC